LTWGALAQLVLFWLNRFQNAVERLTPTDQSRVNPLAIPWQWRDYPLAQDEVY